MCFNLTTFDKIDADLNDAVSEFVGSAFFGQTHSFV